MVSSVYRSVCNIFRQYCLCLAIYMCEPWEKFILHCITLSIMIALTYTAALFIPNQLLTLVTFVWRCLTVDKSEDVKFI
ncbi:unnamed protein product [Heterobilharzia americana]|nr:unnamed protein product [Heterobilharzia americana]